ncbi:putative quinol monooxygenase [Oceanibium sediminis]|uniref:putative quinol monooxygenase n=1 Tax=Oceanibium sediminis TaxID=2026339 RepID=UPI000DD37196|nr:putative quinol monooxygenase [Oceanibium sediminis]
MYAVIVDWIVAEADAASFADLVEAQARNSLRYEPGCQVFDVCQDPEAPGHFILYELYDDKAAFTEHLDSAHFKAFDEEVEPLTRSKSVQTMVRIVY